MYSSLSVWLCVGASISFLLRLASLSPLPRVGLHCFSVPQHLPHPSPLLLLCFTWGDAIRQGVSVGAGSAGPSVSCASLPVAHVLVVSLWGGYCSQSYAAIESTHFSPSTMQLKSLLVGALNKALVAAVGTNVGCLQQRPGLHTAHFYHIELVLQVCGGVG